MKLLQTCPYENLLLYILFKKAPDDQETTMISYAIYATKPFILEYSTISQLFCVIPESTQSFFWHE